MASACVSYSLYGCSSLREDRRSEKQDPAVDFEFCLEDPVSMLSADELFSDGKLVPVKFCGAKTKQHTSAVNTCRRLEMEMSDVFSPKAPRCTTRWRELLGLKKAHETTVPSSSTSSFKQFLHRGSKSSAAPLLKDSDISTIASSRLSLSSSSSSGHEVEDIPRLSLDLDKPSPNPFAPSRRNPRIRLAKPSNPSLDSPRLNASGKIVYHGLERSSSSPTGMKQHHGMPRSYSAHVRIAPVLNVPVSSLKSGLFFGHIFSSSPGNKSQLHSNGKNRTNRTRLEPKCELNN